MASEADVSGPKHYGQKNNKGEDRVNGKEMLAQQSINWFSQNQEDRLLDQYYHQNRGDERLMMSYSIGDFPIKMDGTEFLVDVRFLVAMHHINRFNMIFVRVKWRTLQELSMCAVLLFGSPDADIRLAAQECCSNLEQFVHASGTNRQPVSRLSAKYLNDHHILIMDKRSDSFPDAIYWCSLCDYHMNNVQHVRRHFEMHPHFQEEQRLNERKELLKRLPGMSPNQLIAINSLIDGFLHEKDEKERGSMWQQRVQLSNDVCKLLSREVFGKMGFEVQISLYGSVLTKTCIGSSDLNLSIDIPQMDCGDAVETMRQATELLNSTCDVLDAQFSTDVPMCIKFTWSNVCIRVTWRCESGVKFGKFLSVYTAVRPQFAELCRVVRRWAEVSLIYATDRNLGGLASYAFDIMLLYFLQRKGLLPCLHEMRPIISHETDSLPLIDDFYEKRALYESDIDTIIAKIGTPDKPWNLGELFVEFLSFYGSRLHQNEVVQVYTSKEVNKDRSRWSRKLLQISDPFRTDNVVTFSKAYQAYFFNCFLKSYLYFAIPQTASGPMLDVTLYQKMGDGPHERKSKRGRDRKESDAPKMSESPLKKKAKPDTPKAANSLQSKQQENARKEKMDLSDLLPNDIDGDELTAAANELADEEARSAMRKEILEDMMETATVHDIPLKNLTPENVEIDDSQVYSRRTMNRIRVSNPSRIPRDVFETLQRFRLAARKFAERDLEADKMDHFRCEVYRHRTKREKMRAKIAEAAVEMICFEDFFVKLEDFDEQDFKKKTGELEADRFVYSFDDANNFNSGYKPYMVCASCESTGHWTDVCPLMKIPTVESISHEKAEYEWSELAEIVWRNFERSRITSDRIDAVGEFVEKMRSHLHQSLNTAIRLNIFGSLNSGFGVAKSDVDICFRFESVDQPEDVDGVRIVEQIADCLQQMEGVEKVYAITGAKVPIVKFVCPGLGIDGDISYYNVLALSNTELLKTYCAWDKRVAPLGVWIKRWAKMCDIGDASRGSLSSYAYIILLLHYLQNCDPPLVPRLQEDFRSADTQPEIIENCDVYFHKDVIEGWSKNKQTLGELFIGFLDYYARFDFGTQVVQMRRKKPLLKTEKEWNRSLCIEDPFDLRHNLGAGITKKMFVFIVRNIHNSRKRFMLSECRKTFLEGHSLPLEKQMPQSLCDDYATLVLQDCHMGSAPSDRQCRICHCIGHFADSCQKAAQQAPRREGEKLNRRVAVPPLPKQDMTLEELRKYDGVQDEHILFALNGTIYDVTRGSSFYDPSGPYGALAGRDATRALSTMNVKNLREQWDDHDGLTADEKETANEWEASFKYKYPTVGKLIKEDEVRVDYGGALSSTQA